MAYHRIVAEEAAAVVILHRSRTRTADGGTRITASEPARSGRPPLPSGVGGGRSSWLYRWLYAVGLVTTESVAPKAAGGGVRWVRE